MQTDSLSEKSSLYEGNGDEYISPAKDYSEMEWTEINGETFNGTEEYAKSVFDMDEIQNESKDNSASEKESVVASLTWGFENGILIIKGVGEIPSYPDSRSLSAPNSDCRL